jgi:hypothetical protein
VNHHEPYTSNSPKASNTCARSRWSAYICRTAPRATPIWGTSEPKMLATATTRSRMSAVRIERSVRQTATIER